jgi:hypothetical protein
MIPERVWPATTPLMIMAVLMSSADQRPAITA